MNNANQFEKCVLCKFWLPTGQTGLGECRFMPFIWSGQMCFPVKTGNEIGCGQWQGRVKEVQQSPPTPEKKGRWSK
jgi:hypothetical protein